MTELAELVARLQADFAEAVDLGERHAADPPWGSPEQVAAAEAVYTTGQQLKAITERQSKALVALAHENPRVRSMVLEGRELGRRAAALADWARAVLIAANY